MAHITEVDDLQVVIPLNRETIKCSFIPASAVISLRKCGFTIKDGFECMPGIFVHMSDLLMFDITQRREKLCFTQSV